MKDVVDEAAEALRQTYPGERRPDTLKRLSGARRFTESGRRTRAPRWVFWPIAATLLLLGTAWATPSGTWRTLVAWVGSRDQAQDTAPVANATSGSSSLGLATPQLPPALPPSASATPAVQTDTPVSATASASAPSTLQVATAAVTGPSRASPGPTTSSSPRAEADASPGPRRDADTLYQEAHDAHFRDGDYARAAELWDRYLRAGGPLAPEARYNRGVALLRTGQRDEARKVLQPFADGEYGNYRRREAESLLRSLP